MHIIIGLFYAISRLQNSGAIDSLNPFLWYRRAQWRKKLGTKPMYSLTDPIDIAGLVIVGIAKTEGELSKEQKQEILTIFEQEFHLNNLEAQHLFKSSSFLMNDGVVTAKDIDKIFERSKLKFSQDQVNSLLSFMQHISKVDSVTSAEQHNIIDTINIYFQNVNQDKQGW